MEPDDFEIRRRMQEARRMAESRGAESRAEEPVDAASVATIQRKHQADDARRQMTFGVVLLVVGIALTAAAYSSGDGRYIYLGPIVVGIIQIVRGLINKPDRTPEQVTAAGRVVVPLPSAHVVSSSTGGASPPPNV